MSIRVQLRRDLETVWATKNPVLHPGEPGVEVDTHRVKLGDGTTPWLLLRYSDGKTVTTQAYAATITPNVDITEIMNVGALTGNLTLANPVGNPMDGQNLQFRFSQDSVGSHIITYGSAYVFGTDVTSILDPVNSSAKWERLFTWHGPDQKWRATAIIRGF